MLTSAASRRHALGALMGAWLACAGAAPASAQQGCIFGEGGNDVLDQRTVPGGGTITYVTRPHFVCDDGVQIWADSAVAYSADAISHLLGRVRYQDRTRELTSTEARYFSNVGRLQASGDVVVIDRADGSRVENGDLVYLRSTASRPEESMTVTTGRDGRRPRATVPPPASDSAVVGTEPPRPYIVVGDRIFFRGDSYFNATGNVEIDRDSLFAFADSAEYEGSSESLVLVGSARVESASYDLTGRTITVGTSSTGPGEIRAVREATLTGEDLRLTAPEIRLYLVDDRLERLVAVPLRPIPPDTVGGGTTTGIATAPDSLDLLRPVAISENFELTADSLELLAPAEVVERIFAAGRARSVSQARDSLNVELLPEQARTDWLEGDTIVVTLSPRDSVSPAGSGGDAAVGPDGAEREYVVEQIVARVNARSLYRLIPEDSTARVGIDPPAVHYVVGDEITIHMRDGEVEAMEVVGQTRGVHLEPLARPPASDGDAPAAPPVSVPSVPLAGGPSGTSPRPGSAAPPAAGDAPSPGGRR